MTVATLATLLVKHTKPEIYSFALGIANAVGLPVSSWQAGDPTRSALLVEAEFLSGLEDTAAGYVGSGFLDYAVGVWRAVIAKQVFNIDIPDATFATTDVVLTNTSGGVYDGDAGDLIFKCTTTGKTYHSTTAYHLAAKVGAMNGTATVTVIADEAGSASTAGAGQIDALVTTLGTVTCSNAVAAVGLDAQDWATTKQQCLDKLGSLSPNGPRDAYSYVARNSALSLTSNVTRVRVYGSSTTGAVTVYLAGPSGGVAEADRALVQTAILKWATPLCITPTILAASGVVVPVTYQLWLYTTVNKTAAQVAADVQTALSNLFAARPIGGDIIPPSTTGALYASMIESTIRAVYPNDAFRCVVTLPAGDTAITNGQVATLGTVTPTITLVSP